MTESERIFSHTSSRALILHAGFKTMYTVQKAVNLTPYELKPQNKERPSKSITIPTT